MTYHSCANESVRMGVSRDTDPETRTALAAFCRRNGYPYLFTEVLEPLLSEHGLVLALAVTERPWPPKGIGSRTIEAVGIAMIGTEGRAHLTPVLTDRRNATNIGLVGALTKQLLEHLREADVPSAGYLVRQGDRALEHALERAGFAEADFRSSTDFADYLEFAASPDKVLDALGLAALRVGDLLALGLDGGELDRLGSYHFALTAGLTAYLQDSLRNAALLPGLIDLVATLPPGGVPPGTPGPPLT
ncbi:hypothetical protein [Streptomyces sp. Root1310]|uniref:hypothetical protein n=1 Tax=Streptomyces sp. Root1310 TaxID=1736452 RepID=UPI0007090E5E|nr:hypothetical protein [Streptomyces sp. Root1310]KQX67384.1 hypothetical protein ASD48_14980 [Streptomyces sp. Root1310]